MLAGLTETPDAMVTLVMTPGRSVKTTFLPGWKISLALVCSLSQLAVLVSQAVLEAEFQTRFDPKAITLKETKLEFDAPLLFVAVIVKVKLPEGVLVAVITSRMDEPALLSDGGVKLALAFAGRPLKANDTGPTKPAFVVRAIV